MKTSKSRLQELANIQEDSWNPNDTLVLQMEVTIQDIMNALQPSDLELNPDMMVGPGSVAAFEDHMAKMLTDHLKKGTRLDTMLRNMWKEGAFKTPKGEMIIQSPPEV
jgi:hypothetical protein